MKITKFLFIAAIVMVLQLKPATTMAQKVSGTNYTTAVGLFLDLGNGGTYVGPHVKHYFTANDAGQAMVLFGNHSTIVGVEYAYNQVIPGADGLKWNIGVGPQLAFNDDFTDFLLRPQVGLEYKVNGAPIALGFDWRPAWTLTHGSNFEAGRFGLAFKYALK